MKLESVSALVTGGASGLGAATVRRFAARGISCVIADLDVAGGEQLARETTGAVFVPTDVTDYEAVERAARTAGELGNPRILVGCAGVAPPVRRIVDRKGDPMSVEAWRSQIDINLTGMFHAVSAMAAVIVNQPASEDETQGVIVTTSSMARRGAAGAAAYAAAKAGVAALTISAARDLSIHRIRCVSIAPGMFETPMLAVVAPDNPAGTFVTDFPKRPGRPEEFAALVEHICENDYLNTVCLDIDAGVHD